MGMTEKAKQKVKDAVEKAGDKADQMTGNKYSDKVDKGQNRAQESIDAMSSRQQRPEQQQQQ